MEVVMKQLIEAIERKWHIGAGSTLCEDDQEDIP